MYDFLVFGGGPGGYVAALRAAQLGQKVAVISEDPYLGGTCLNVGCIPSKTLLEGSELFWKMQTIAPLFGISAQNLSMDPEQLRLRSNAVIQELGDGVAQLCRHHKVEWLKGTGRFLDAHTIEVNEQRIVGKKILIATGSQPIGWPDVPFDEEVILSSTGALQLKKIPKKLLVIGGGVIGLELGSVYQRLGAQVTVVEAMERICASLDEYIGGRLHQSLTKQGMQIVCGTKVTLLEKSTSGGARVRWDTMAEEEEALFDQVLVAIGRRPRSSGLGLEKTGVVPDARGLVRVNARFQTSVEHLFAVGDLIEGPMLAHRASAEGIAVADFLVGKRTPVNYAALPSVIYTHPEVATVGLSEQEARAAGLDIMAGLSEVRHSGRAKCQAEHEGCVKVIGHKQSGRLLGVHVFAPHASEWISAAATAIALGATVEQIAQIPYAHPTLSELLAEAARAAQPHRVS